MPSEVSCVILMVARSKILAWVPANLILGLAIFDKPLETIWHLNDRVVGN